MLCIGCCVLFILHRKQRREHKDDQVYELNLNEETLRASLANCLSSDVGPEASRVTTFRMARQPTAADMNRETKGSQAVFDENSMTEEMSKTQQQLLEEEEKVRQLEAQLKKLAADHDEQMLAMTRAFVAHLGGSTKEGGWKAGSVSRFADTVVEAKTKSQKESSAAADAPGTDAAGPVPTQEEQPTEEVPLVVATVTEDAIERV